MPSKCVAKAVLILSDLGQSIWRVRSTALCQCAMLDYEIEHYCTSLLSLLFHVVWFVHGQESERKESMNRLSTQRLSIRMVASSYKRTFESHCWYAGIDIERSSCELQLIRYCHPSIPKLGSLLNSVLNQGLRKNDLLTKFLENARNIEFRSPGWWKESIRITCLKKDEKFVSALSLQLADEVSRLHCLFIPNKGADGLSPNVRSFVALCHSRVLVVIWLSRDHSDASRRHGKPADSARISRTVFSLINACKTPSFLVVLSYW